VILLRISIIFEVGDGKNIHIWMDNWHPAGVLFEKHGFRAVYDAQSRVDAKLSTVLINSVWCWRPTRSDAVVDKHVYEPSSSE
jgi:hypothetical protein